MSDPSAAFPAVTPISLLVEASQRESFETFQHEMAQAMLFTERRRNRSYALGQALKADIPEGLFVEFGVAGGASCRQFGKILGRHGKSLHGFDSFEGLQEDWTGKPTGREAGAFTRSGELPDVPDNVTLHKGWIEDTLPGYVDRTAPAPFAFIHMDMDTYTPTEFALRALVGRLQEGTVVLFDEFYGYPGWRHHEYKALQEVIAPECYRFLSFSNESVAIQLTARP